MGNNFAKRELRKGEKKKRKEKGKKRREKKDAPRDRGCELNE